MRAKIEAPELCDEATVALASEIRDDHHPELCEAAIAYIFIPKGPRNGAHVRLGKAKREAAIHRLVSKVDFIIILSYDRWVKMEARQRAALLDHELCHCAPKFNRDDERVGWRIRRHDIEEFSAVIQRHGLVFAYQQDFARRTQRQLELAFGNNAV